MWSVGVIFFQMLYGKKVRREWRQIQYCATDFVFCFLFIFINFTYFDTNIKLSVK